MRTQRAQHARQRGLVVVRVQPQVGRRDAPLRRHRGGFEDQQRRAGQRQVAEVDQVPVAGAAVDSRVLAHRRDDDAVVQLQVADSQRREEFAHGSQGL